MNRIEKRRENAWQNGFAVGNSGGGTNECQEVQGTIFYDDWHDGFYTGEAKMIEEEEIANGTR